MAADRWMQSQSAAVLAGMARAIHKDPAGTKRALKLRLMKAAANGDASLLAECAACPPHVACLLRPTRGTLRQQGDWPSPGRLGLASGALVDEPITIAGDPLSGKTTAMGDLRP